MAQNDTQALVQDETDAADLLMEFGWGGIDARRKVAEMAAQGDALVELADPGESGPRMTLRYTDGQWSTWSES